MTSSMTMTMSDMESMTMSTASSTAAAATATSTAMSMSMGDSSSCKISMLWNWYTIDACFLAQSWHITTKGAFAASCIGVMLLVVSLELLRRVGKEYDTFILRQFQRNIALDGANLKGQDNSGSCQSGPQIVTFRASPLQQLVRSVIHAMTFGLAYIIMLLAMYFNGFIIICIFIGAFLGKFLCDWMVQRVPMGGLLEQSGSQALEEPSVCCG
ncbi:putative high affinity copper protein [Exophiala viscosa]|uniref:Copper transport protein n=1 Tax=Exophiala viscosa TaxID=2486360 RepID=A0AAN6DYM7_9EURO|nr:putative high affinity copper protein [Exophiala viscosa]KAI1621265.1 putative high affinity copper protein [Exophiala viscosa]